VVLRPPKIAKNCNFLYKFAPKKKSRGSMEKFEYRCTTRNLPLCNCTIIVLKIILLHSVSVITNFVIPKRDKQTDRQTDRRKHITLFRLQPARDLRSHHTWHGDRRGQFFAPPNFFKNPISSFAVRGYWKFDEKCPHRERMLITWLFFSRKQPY